MFINSPKIRLKISKDKFKEVLSMANKKGNDKIKDVKKAAKTTARDLYDLKGKLVRFGMSRGFELEDVLAATDQVLREREP